MTKTLLGLAAILVFTATTVLYFTGPTTKTVSKRTWQDAYCARFYYEAKTNSLGIPTGGSRRVCDERAPAGYTTDRDTVRTSAWERITGAVTGTGNVE
jgi:hypothetical protein